MQGRQDALHGDLLWAGRPAPSSPPGSATLPRVPATDLLTSVDDGLVRAAAGLRWAPLTALMTLLSAWWVKGIAIAALGAVADLRRRPRRIPPTPLVAAVAILTASWASSALKDVFDRVRPPLADHAIGALVAVPRDASFPSGHAATAFAAAGVVALLHPRLRVAALGLAALVALSRVYLGVHYPSDVLAGAVLGLAIAVAVVRVPFTAAAVAARMRLWRARPST
jgi:undecaprenyl-diphosphatase